MALETAVRDSETQETDTLINKLLVLTLDVVLFDF